MPVVNLGDNRTDLVHQILKASQELGLFDQVVNHGVPAKLVSVYSRSCLRCLQQRIRRAKLHHVLGRSKEMQARNQPFGLRW
ncbi:hypothetical protein HRI_002244200 [Hibiscus trionum]|uniref:Non-haem dioxygenase N-terminal domain-containing protein n=1 Tax=Hibiscus trionum TaxID=183268 RepID=A0A9W7HY26_HIBTR|nr:hypothetical protein HRI_002244200 [Hibiscus trionum]